MQIKPKIDSGQVDDLVFTINESTQNIESVGDTQYEGVNAAKFLNRLLLDAMALGASDIHFEPFEELFRIRARVDGVMTVIKELPRAFGHQLIIRIKVIAGLDISEQRETQSGRFRVRIGSDIGIDFRCSIVPSLHGEVLVLRMLYLPEDALDYDRLGLDADQVAVIERCVHRQQGMILVTGPTGSGKSVTLYTLLRKLNAVERSIYTAEDPVEMNVPGVNQININERQGVGFGPVARTILRQDPDVIMLGEMRDAETVDAAIKASNTGHLVLSTLHANTAPKAIPRLLNLGADRFDVSSSLSLVISQRLLRCLNPDTAVPVTYPKARLLAAGFEENDLDSLQLYEPQERAGNKGYLGRVGIYQIMEFDETLARIVAEGANEWEISHYLTQNGIEDLRDAAIRKVKAGVTDLNELERILGQVKQAKAGAQTEMLSLELGDVIEVPANLEGQRNNEGQSNRGFSDARS